MSCLGWEGEFCSDKIDYCKGVTCENDGLCRSADLGYRCDCLPGYDGPLCEVNIDECSSKPCKNKGHCVDGINSFLCDCNATGFTGKPPAEPNELCKSD